VLCILFRLGDARYALDASSILEILPLVNLNRVLRPPRGIAGLLNHRGVLIPVIDLSELALGYPAQPRLSTRIILAQCSEADGTRQPLGLITEHATEAMRCEPQDFVSSGILHDDAQYLGPVSMTPHGLVQRIELDQLLPATMRRSLTEQSPDSR
jgi:chemotaxis-related protein WspB